MNRAAKFILLLAVVAATAFFSALAGERVDAAPGESGAMYRAGNIAVVNIEEITNDWMRRTGAAEKIEQKYLTQRRGLESLRSVIESMDQESQIHPQQSQRYVDLRAQIAVKSAELKFRNEATRASRDLEQAKLMTEAYEKAVEVIEAIAKERGLDMVLLKQTGDLSSQMLLQEVTSNILVRSVVFSRGNIDITDDVKNRMQ